MRRAGVYFFFDKDGIVDSYVPYYLHALHEVVDYIVVVVNGKLTPEGRKTLLDCADDLFVRENVGLDAWAFKDALEYIGWEELMQFDELVLTNSTVFGPIFPFQETFAQMDAADCDFWGMFTVYEDENLEMWLGVSLPWGYKPEYIASNFTVYKSSVLHSFEFRSHWSSLPEIRTYYESSVYHEMSLSKRLSDAGFVMAAVDQGAFRTVCPSSTVYGAYDMIAKYHVPIIRKKAFYDPNCLLDYCTDVPQKAMKYICENTGYPTDLIWDNLLRTVNQYDLKNWMNWNIVLPADYAPKKAENCKLAVIFHVYYMDIMESYLHNIESFPEGCHFYFTTDTEEKRENLRRLMAPYESRFHMEYRLVENRGRDVSALLVGCRDVVLDQGYDLICFMHDKKGVGNASAYSCVGQAFSDSCFENIAPTAAYVTNVISLFQQQPRLGIAVPPPPNYANYYKNIGGSWTINYMMAEKLMDDLRLTIPMEMEKPPIAPYGTVFWFRPTALTPLFKRKWKYTDFDEEPANADGTMINAIERGYSLIAQGCGYYPSVIMNNAYAGQEITRTTEIARQYIDLTLQYVGPKMTYHQAHVSFTKMLNVKKRVSTEAWNSQSQASVRRRKRGRVKRLARGICPIGLWNLLRRLKCRVNGDVYIEPVVERSALKSFIRACMPRAIWDQLRKSKCKENGWVFVPED